MTRPVADDKGSFNRRALPHRFALGKNPGLPLLFLLLIFLPLADMVFKICEPLPIKEKRRLADTPRFEWRKPWSFLEESESYFNDHFGFRTHLLYQHNRLTVGLFGVSPTDKVIIGRQGWLFMARESETRNELDYFRQLTLLTPQQVRHWRNMLRQRRRWLEERGIAYMFIVVPNKSTVYSEFMPANIRRRHGQSRLDQLLAALAREDDFPVIDLRETLAAAKRSYRIYNKTDSHWNELGAFFAFEKIMARLARIYPELDRPALEDFIIEYSDRNGGDLALMLSLQKVQFREQTIRLRPKIPVATRLLRPKRSLGPYIRETSSECPSATLPTLLLVHDSFVHQLKPLLNPRFRRIIYIWDWGLHFFKDAIEEEKPEIVIEEITERVLADLVLENPPGLGPATDR